VKQHPRVILLIPAVQEYDRALRRGIIEYAETHGPWAFYEEAPAYLRSLTPRQSLRIIRGWNAKGILVGHGRFADARSLRIPMVVAMGTRRLGESYFEVVTADREIGQMGASTFIGLGFRHFAYCGLAGLSFSDDRGLGFIQKIQEAGYSVDLYSSPIRDPRAYWYAETKRIAGWLSTLAKPSGLMACNDDRARMLVDICRARKIHVPDEISILGVDNDEQVCKSCNPPLSSIALAAEKGGYEAAALLASLMSGQRPDSRVVTISPTYVVSRQSTDILAIQDRAMVQSLRFIRDNSNRNLLVADLAKAAGLSRRVLQDRFKHFLGRTPMEEIHRCRAERIARLLVETNMTVGQIGQVSGFEVEAHVARFFSSQTGMTPLAYRRKNRIPSMPD
jgi:LacI family transcriptional regulator